MDRREFLQPSIMATLAGKVLSDVTLARAQAPAAAPRRAAAGQAARVAVAAPRRLIMDATRATCTGSAIHDEIAEAAIEMTCGGVKPTVQAYPGHIDPTKVAQELPAFVKTMQKHGLRVKQMRGGNQTTSMRPTSKRWSRRWDSPASRTIGAAPTTTT